MSLLLLGLCIGAATYLYRLQANTAEILGENVVTRKIDLTLLSSWYERGCWATARRNRIGSAATRAETSEARTEGITIFLHGR